MPIEPNPFDDERLAKIRADQTDPIIQYFIVRTDLEMSIGKIAAQVAHGAEMFIMRVREVCLVESYSYCGPQGVQGPINQTPNPEQLKLVEQWLAGSFRKVVLGGKKKDFDKIIEDLPVFVVRDAGLTEVAPNSDTVLVTWPMYKSAQPKCLARLQTLKWIDMSEKSTFGVAPYNPFPIEVTSVGREGIGVKGPGVDITLCAHGANFLATKLIEVANKQYYDGYVHGDEATMLLSPKIVGKPITGMDILNAVDPLPIRPPTCETLDELLQKLQTFVQEHSNVEVLPLDDAYSGLWGYGAWFVENGLETSISATIPVRNMQMSPELRARVMPMFRTAKGRIRLAAELGRGVKFV
jgi:PTH2 family peptidyl-tRNA hydrolase